MIRRPILCVQRNPAIRSAAQYLTALGLPITHKPAPDVSHVLLPIPSFPTGYEYLAHLLADLPDDVVISGGNLDIPLLKSRQCVDFLQDPHYLAQNASITAECAMQIIEEKLQCGLTQCPVLLTGWGRIGKCLHRLLEQKQTDLSVAVRKESDQAMIRALGCRSVLIRDLPPVLHRYELIVNTVPAMILPDLQVAPDVPVLELASRPGIRSECTIDGRGLPSKMAPEKSGRLIAETFIRLSMGKELLI